eukprot:comp22130_c0_seq1/m.32372 comp22130_c0_seq1/g.32372  ORF comp22130_c0_seq1/g.32372 comp22130_c0_seq1/m.32372 type:complete len:149 (-) comp22130_c0_seq1:272-718(-)
MSGHVFRLAQSARAVTGRTLLPAMARPLVAVSPRRFFQDVNFPSPQPLPRPNEDIEKKRRRLVYQSRKRGMLENCLLLSTFAGAYLDKLTLEQLHQYDKLLDENDWDIFYWVTGKKEVPEKHNHDVFKMLAEYSKNERKEALRMPELS